MKLKADDVLGKKAQKKTMQMPEEELQSQPIEQEPQENLFYDVPEPSRTRLEHDFVTSGLSYGDRMRVVSPDGTLKDIILMPDGESVAIQDLTVRIDYGAQMNYASWQEIDAALQGYDFYQAIVAKRKIALLMKVIEATLDTSAGPNPYNKGKPEK